VFGRQFVDDRQVDSLAPSGRIGFGFGVQGTLEINENAALFAGAGVNFIGLNDFRDLDYSQDVVSPVLRNQSLSLSYFNIPFGFQMTSFDLGNGFYLKALAGLELDILAGARLNGAGSKVRVNSHIQPLNLGAFGRLGGEVDLFGAGYLDFGISYHHGFFNILKKNFEVQVDPDGPSGLLGASTVKPYELREVRLSYVAVDIGFIFK
jgi:hypothetical protein